MLWTTFHHVLAAMHWQHKLWPCQKPWWPEFRFAVLPEIWRRWRNRLTANSRFIALAQAFPLTRPIARRRSRQLFDLVAGFAYSQVLYSCVQLNLFEQVGQSGQTLGMLALRLGWDEPKTLRLIKAAAALQLLELHGNTVSLGVHGAALLGQPWIMRFIAHHHLFYDDLADPIGLLSGQKPGQHLKSFWDYGHDPRAKADYTGLMAASQTAVAAEILNAYDFSNHDTVLDVGGGDGSFLRALTARHPNIKRQLFDLPGVIDIADAHPGNLGTSTFSGHFAKDALPAGADVVTLVRVAHDHDDDVVRVVFRNIFQCLRNGPARPSAFILAEPMSGNAATAPVTDAYFNLYFAAMGQGRTRTPQELIEMAREAGFSRHRQLSTRDPLITSLLVFEL
jgi:demethylspheroidene O-methyltransferase